MKKNAQLHVMIESDLVEELKKEARDRRLSLSELCRVKLKESDRLKRMENLLNEIAKILTNKGRTEKVQE